MTRFPSDRVRVLHVKCWWFKTISIATTHYHG